MTGSQILDDLLKTLCVVVVFWVGLLSALSFVIQFLPEEQGRQIVNVIDEVTFNRPYPTGK